MDRDDQRCSISNMCHNESIEVGKNRGLDLRQRLKQPSVDLCHPSFPPVPLIAVDGSMYLLGSATKVVVVLVLQVPLVLQVLIMRVTSATATATILPSHRCSVLVVILVLAKFQHLPLSLSSLICH